MINKSKRVISLNIVEIYITQSNLKSNQNHFPCYQNTCILMTRFLVLCYLCLQIKSYVDRVNR